MDPLSITSNIIAVLNSVKAAVSVLEKLRELLKAPEQLLQTLNEVSDFQAILISTQETASRFHELNINSSFVLRFNKLIGETGDLVANILSTIRLCVRSNDPSHESGFDISRRIWLRERSNIQRLGFELRRRREEISSLLTIVSASRVPYVRIDLDRISVTSQDLRRKMKEHGESFSKKLKTIEGDISIIRPQLEDLEAYTLSWLSQNSLLTKPNPKVRRPPFSYEDLSKTTGKSISNFRVEATLYRQAPCNSRCLCRCHKLHIVKTPKLMEHLIGSMFIGYSNTPLNRTTCNEKLCKQQKSSLLRVNYYFPSWFMHRMVAIKNMWDTTQGLQINVRTPRVVEYSSDVFLIADHGNLDSLKALFAKGLASPFDVSSGTGHSLLHTAVTRKRVDFCKFLLEQYADPEAEDKQSTSAIDAIWDMWLADDTDPITQELTRVFSAHLDSSSDLQKRGFTILHQIVLRLNSLDLETSLQLSTSTIDVQCSKGRTPLAWAIMRGQSNDTRLLIEYGADIKLASNGGYTPLHLACRIPLTDCLDLLLSALDSESSLADSRAELNPTIENAYYHYTPFHFAQFEDNIAHAKLLLAHCTTPEATTDMIERVIGTSGAASLNLSLQRNSHRCLKLLLSLGARTDRTDRLGLNLLHLTAVCGDFESIKIMLAAAVEGRINGCSVEARDSYGYTPLEDFDIVRKKYVNEDETAFEKSRGLFLQLLQKVSPAIEVIEGKDSESENEEFFDVGLPAE